MRAGGSGAGCPRFHERGARQGPGTRPAQGALAYICEHRPGFRTDTGYLPVLINSHRHDAA
jgi:hypothetical protein